MDLSVLVSLLGGALTGSGWTTVLEDDYPDFKHLVCHNLSGPLGVFTRFDLLMVTPEPDPAEASGACLSFLFYADPGKVDDMRRVGRAIRHQDSLILRSHGESILLAANIAPGIPSCKVVARPKHEKVEFSDGNLSHPAFMVVIEYWLGREKLPPAQDTRSTQGRGEPGNSDSVPAESDWPLKESMLIAPFKVTDMSVDHHAGENPYYQISVCGFILDSMGGVLFASVQLSADDGDVERVAHLEHQYRVETIHWLECDCFSYGDETISVYNPESRPVPQENYDGINDFFPREIRSVQEAEQQGKKFFYAGKIYREGGGRLLVYKRPRVPPLPDDFYDRWRD